MSEKKEMKLSEVWEREEIEVLEEMEGGEVLRVRREGYEKEFILVWEKESWRVWGV